MPLKTRASFYNPNLLAATARTCSDSLQCIIAVTQRIIESTDELHLTMPFNSQFNSMISWYESENQQGRNSPSLEIQVWMKKE